MKRQLLLTGYFVREIVDDGRFRLSLSSKIGADAKYVLVVEGKFIFHAIGADEGADAGEVLRRLVGQEVSGVVVEEDGGARVRFSGDLELFVPPDPDYEAWQLYGPRGMIWVSGPGGQVTTWGPQ